MSQLCVLHVHSTCLPDNESDKTQLWVNRFDLVMHKRMVIPETKKSVFKSNTNSRSDCLLPVSMGALGKRRVVLVCPWNVCHLFRNLQF